VTAVTPGQAAYEAAVRVMLDGEPDTSGEGPDFAWNAIGNHERRSWEAAAQAVAAPLERELAALRELLDEIGVMAANAPEDGDSYGLLEEIAMRIAAAGVPDTTPIDEWPDPENPVTGRTPGDVIWVTPGDGTPIGGLLAHVGIRPNPAPEQEREDAEAGQCPLCEAPLNRDGSCSRSCAGVGDG